jgi:polyferredoxin
MVSSREDLAVLASNTPALTKSVLQQGSRQVQEALLHVLTHTFHCVLCHLLVRSVCFIFLVINCDFSLSSISTSAARNQCGLPCPKTVITDQPWVDISVIVEAA